MKVVYTTKAKRDLRLAFLWYKVEHLECWSAS